MSTFAPGPLAAGLALVALVPVVAYAVGTGAPAVALSAICVVLVAASLYYMLSPTRSAPATAEQ